MSNYCEYKVGARITCKKTNDPNLNSDKCEINKKTRRCIVKKLKKTKKLPKKQTKLLSDLNCSNEEDPITFSHFKDDSISPDNILQLPYKDGKSLCFETETIWTMFANHVNHEYAVFLKVSNNDFTNIAPIDMSVWGIQKNLLTIDSVKDFIKKRAKEGIKKKEFRDPNAPYVPKGNSSSAILENFLVDRIDPNNSIHVEFLTKAILGQHPSSSGINIETEWRNMVEIIYATWIEPPSNQIVYLKPLTTKARLEINSLPSNEERRLYFINLLINLYNGILKRSTPDEARSKVTMLLWALNLTIQE
tara:strand:+ start:37 stop:951 length:915 start_codon:yes stop_codon:yes gene_type:complete